MRIWVEVLPSQRRRGGGGRRTLPSPPGTPRLLGLVDASFRALSGRLQFTAQRHKFKKDSLSVPPALPIRPNRPITDLRFTLIAIPAWGGFCQGELQSIWSHREGCW